MTIEEKSLPESFNEIHVALPTEQLHRGRSFLIFQRQNGYQQREFRFDRLDESLTPLSLRVLFFIFYFFGNRTRILDQFKNAHRSSKKKKKRTSCGVCYAQQTFNFNPTTNDISFSHVFCLWQCLACLLSARRMGLLWLRTLFLYFCTFAKF